MSTLVSELAAAWCRLDYGKSDVMQQGVRLDSRRTKRPVCQELTNVALLSFYDCLYHN